MTNDHVGRADHDRPDRPRPASTAGGIHLAEVAKRVEKPTIEEFVQLYDEEGPLEIIDGEIVKMTPTVFRH